VTDHHPSGRIGVVTVILPPRRSFDFHLIGGFTGYRARSGCCDEDEVTDFGLSLWLIIYVNSVLALLHRVVVGDVASVSEVRAASIFRVEVCMLVSFCVYITLCFRKRKGDRVGIGASPRPVGTVDRERCADGPLKGPGMHRKSHR
jgi:hypothetical protein